MEKGSKKSEVELEKEFLDEFKILENYLVSKSNLKDDFVSFSRALTYLYENQLDPVISNSLTYEFLKTSNELRNVMSHKRNVCVPTYEFLEKFKKIKKSIVDPIDCFDCCVKLSKVVYLNLNSTIKEAVNLLNKYNLSHLPILSDSKVLGVFSRSTLFDIYTNSNYKVLDLSLSEEDSYTIRDIMKYCDINNHLNEAYLFVSRSTSILSLFHSLRKVSKDDKRIGLVFVTQNGKPSEKLLGVITQIDLLNVGPND